MPYSLPSALSSIAEEIYTRQPKRLLDLGIGDGLYGCIARRYIDGIYGRCRPDQWQAEIVGIEAWTEYGHVLVKPAGQLVQCWSCEGSGVNLRSALMTCPICGGSGQATEAAAEHHLIRNPMWDCYTAVIAGDFTDPAVASFDGGLRGWDMVLMLDSLEHLPWEVGSVFLDRLVQHNRCVIVSVPMGLSEQGAVHGNEFERHRTTFNAGERQFEQYTRRVLHRGYSWVFAIEGGSEN